MAACKSPWILARGPLGKVAAAAGAAAPIPVRSENLFAAGPVCYPGSIFFHLLPINVGGCQSRTASISTTVPGCALASFLLLCFCFVYCCVGFFVFISVSCPFHYPPCSDNPLALNRASGESQEPRYQDFLDITTSHKWRSWLLSS
jgi:hypothetical protein